MRRKDRPDIGGAALTFLSKQRPVVRIDSPSYGTQNLTYTLIVTNKGPEKATNVQWVAPGLGDSADAVPSSAW